MKTRLSASSVVIIIGVCAALVGCGEESTGSREAGSDADRVRAVIVRAATSKSPADCTRLATQRFLEQTALVKGPAAVESCREHARDGGNPRTVRVSAIKVEGASARARAAFEGGSLDGQTVNLRLVRRAKQWKIDHLDSFATFNRARLLRAVQRDLVRPPDALPEATARCVTAGLDTRSDGEIQQLYVKPRLDELMPFFAPCIGDLLKQELAGQAIPEAVVDCVTARVGQPPYAIIREMLVNERHAQRMIETAVLECFAASS